MGSAAIQSRVQTRITLKNILYCTDFSEAATHALPYAAKFARHFGSTLFGVHVRPNNADRTEVSAMERYSDLEAKGKLQVEMGRFKGIAEEEFVPEGEIWPCLEQVIREKKIDLVVIGTRGLTGLSKFLLGSSAEEIFRRAGCAVLTVGPHAPTQPPKDAEISEILYATDFSRNSDVAAPYAISMAEEYQARLTMLHVLPEWEDGDLEVVVEEMERAALNKLRAMIPEDCKPWCEGRAVIAHGAAADQILRVAEERDTGLIVLGVHPPEGFPGATTHLWMTTAHRVVAQARCPVLTLRG